MDQFNIKNVEKLINQEPNEELSDISVIIKSMIALKNNKEHTTVKRSRPYNVEDKIKLNRLGKNIARKIKKYHNERFDLIGDAIDILSEFEYSITDDLYDFYDDVYLEILTKLNIECDNEEIIKDNSEKIYKLIIDEVMVFLYEGKKTDIPSNKRKTYVEAITAYVFYKCIFLIPIENIS